MKWLAFFTIALTLMACENNLEDVQRVTFNSKSPNEAIVNFQMVYSDSGFARVELFSTLAETFHKPAHITQMKDGLKVNFFSATGEIVSTLTSKYGEVNFSTNQLMVRDSVRLYNHKKKQTLKTEKLFWNQKDSSIYTEEKVIVTSPKGYFTGTGLKTKQDFSRYEIMKPQGHVFLEKEDELN